MSLRKTLTTHDPGGLQFDWFPFGEENVERIVEVVRFPLVHEYTVSRLHETLNRQAQWWRAHADHEAAPTDRKILAEIKAVASASRRLAGLLPMVPEANPYNDEAAPHTKLPTALMDALLPLPESVIVPPEYRYQVGTEEVVIPEAFLNGLATGVHHLALIAETVRDRRIEPVEDASPPKATQDLVLSLLPIYRNSFGRKIAVSRCKDTGKPSGPLVRFIKACLDPLEVELSDETLVALIRRRAKITS